jgi:hypothetical protein
MKKRTSCKASGGKAQDVRSAVMAWQSRVLEVMDRDVT